MPDPQVPEQKQAFDAITAAFRKVADRHEADIVFLTGDLERPRDGDFIEELTKRTRRKNVFLVLTTHGGDPNAAYRIARALQHGYSRFTAFVPGYCKSAGTLLILGAHELVLSAHAELGPLDIQLPSKVETDERGSVLTLALR